MFLKLKKIYETVKTSGVKVLEKVELKSSFCAVHIVTFSVRHFETVSKNFNTLYVKLSA